MACPYHTFSKPVICFCEQNLCAYITQPANAWSNLGYAVIGALLLFIYRKSTGLIAKTLPVIFILIGFASFIYHATYTFWGQMLDLGSMFLLASFLIIINLRRINSTTFTLSKSSSIYAIINLGSLLLMYFVRLIGGFNIGILIFALQIAIVILLEYYLFLRAKSAVSYLNFLTGLSIISAACVIWMLDYKHIWCDNSTFHFINGHATWHILTATSFIFIYRHYLQFKIENYGN